MRLWPKERRPAKAIDNYGLDILWSISGIFVVSHGQDDGGGQAGVQIGKEPCLFWLGRQGCQISL